MKFLCTDCDTAMKFKDVTRPQQGSVTALFECPDCFTEIAMYLNPSETQMLKSLDLKLGGNNEAAQPMQLVRSQLDTAKSEGMPNEVSAEMGFGQDEGTSPYKKEKVENAPLLVLSPRRFRKRLKLPNRPVPSGQRRHSNAWNGFQRLCVRWRRWELKVSPKTTDTLKLQAKSWMPPAATSPHNSNTDSAAPYVRRGALSV